MTDDQEDEASRLLKQILSPAEAQSLVLPPPDHAPVSGPGESTPLTGNLTKAAYRRRPRPETMRRYGQGWRDTLPARPPTKQRLTAAAIRCT